MSYNKQEFIGSTVGMQAYHPNMFESKLIRVEYYRTDEGIQLRAVSGRNLARVKVVPAVIISKEEYNDRDHDHCDDAVEFFWAVKILGFDLGDN